MNQKQYDRMHSAPGFIAALDQSGGSTPKALKAYGIGEDAYSNEAEMFDLVHAMRTRIMTDPCFDGSRILAAILFEVTMERKVEGMYTADYLWEERGVIPFVKIDKGLADEENGVRMMKPIPDLDRSLEHAAFDRHIFGTKERSLIMDYNERGIRDIVDQQFELAMTVASHGLVPIIEPEVDIHSPHKKECEEYMHGLFKERLALMDPDLRVMFKLTLPTEADLYRDLTEDPHVVRVVALSGGYSQKEANELLGRNHGVIASFSRALTQDLRVTQTDEVFSSTLKQAVDDIYEASNR